MPQVGREVLGPFCVYGLNFGFESVFCVFPILEFKLRVANIMTIDYDVVPADKTCNRICWTKMVTFAYYGAGSCFPVMPLFVDHYYRERRGWGL